MDLAPDHAAARLVAQRLAAIMVSHARLEDGEGEIVISIYDDPRPPPGEPPTAEPLAVLLVTDATTLDSELYRITLPTPLETLVSRSGGATWARLLNRAGEWWADLEVADEEGAAPLTLSTTQLLAGGILRLIGGVFQG